MLLSVACAACAHGLTNIRQQYCSTRVSHETKTSEVAQLPDAHLCLTSYLYLFQLLHVASFRLPAYLTSAPLAFSLLWRFGLSLQPWWLQLQKPPYASMAPSGEPCWQIRAGTARGSEGTGRPSRDQVMQSGDISAIIDVRTSFILPLQIIIIIIIRHDKTKPTISTILYHGQASGPLPQHLPSPSAAPPQGSAIHGALPSGAAGGCKSLMAQLSALIIQFP